MSTLPPPSGAPQPGLPPRPVLPTLAPSPVASPSPHAAPPPSPAAAAWTPVTARAAGSLPEVRYLTLKNGETVRNGTEPMLPTALLGTLLIVAYIAVVAAITVLALHLGAGWHFVERLDRVGVATPDDIARAHADDARTVRLLIVAGSVEVVAAVITALWSRRVARNTNLANPQRASVGRATWSWFIPIMWTFGGFAQLRRARAADFQVSMWQFLFLAPYVASYFLSRVFSVRTTFDQQSGDSAAKSATAISLLRAEWIMSWTFVGCLGLATVFAASAVLRMRATFEEIDDVRRTA